MSTLVHRLEQALACWEDGCFMKYAFAKLCEQPGSTNVNYCPIEGPVKDWRQLRKHLLSATSQSSLPLKFFGSDKVRHHLGALGPIPGILFSWSKHSRRVFHVTHELQQLLRFTSLEGVRWSDVHFPFDAFAITLEKPLLNDQGEKFDCLLFGETICMGKPYYSITALSQRLGEYAPLGEAGRNKILHAIKTRKWTKLKKEHISLQQRIRQPTFICFVSNDLVQSDDFVIDAGKDEHFSVTDGTVIEESLSSRLMSILPSMVNIAVGLALYLQTLPPNSAHRSAWQKTPQMNALNKDVITDEAEVCSVSSTYALSSKEKELLGIDREPTLTGIEVRTHFRRGYWRRPPGSGKDPGAAKIVWVRPTMVRQDRLQENQLPIGSLTVL